MMIAISFVHRPLTVGRARRRSLLSTEASWMSAAAWTISTTVAQRTASRPRWPRRRATSRSSVGRDFLPRVARTGAATRQAGSEQEKRRTELLTAGREDVSADLVQDRDRGAKQLPEMGLHPL